jgi:hypothetical protein
VTVDDVDGGGPEGTRGRDDVREERPSRQRLQHLGKVARHALALTGSQDDDGQRHRFDCTEAPGFDAPRAQAVICRFAHKGAIPSVPGFGQPLSGQAIMATKLEKPLRREFPVNDELYTLTISPEGLKLVPKGKRKGHELTWRDLLNGQPAVASAPASSLDPA